MVGILIIGSTALFAVVATLILRSGDRSGRHPHRAGRYGSAGGGAYWFGGGDGGGSSCGDGGGCG